MTLAGLWYSRDAFAHEVFALVLFWRRDTIHDVYPTAEAKTRFTIMVDGCIRCNVLCM